MAKSAKVVKSTKGTARRGVRLNVKLVHGVGARGSADVFSATPGVRSAVQLFPGEEEEEMLSHYIVEVEPAEVEQALARLRSDPSVEYVEESAPRKLIW